MNTAQQIAELMETIGGIRERDLSVEDANLATSTYNQLVDLQEEWNKHPDAEAAGGFIDEMMNDLHPHHPNPVSEELCHKLYPLLLHVNFCAAYGMEHDK